MLLFVYDTASERAVTPLVFIWPAAATLVIIMLSIVIVVILLRLGSIIMMMIMRKYWEADYIAIAPFTRGF